MVGYFTYGRFVERYFGVSAERDTPVKRLADGVDYQELKPWRMYVIQFLNIAGLGPIFGAIMGAAYGPMAYLWIVVGCIFMGAAHDFFSGMLSLRNDGKDLPEIVGTYLGKRMRQVLIVFAAFLLLAVGVSFVNGPAELLARLTGWDMTLWLWVIFAYYVFATLLPIDKIIGKVYPFMGGALLFMALGVGAYLIYGDATGAVEMKELTADSLRNFHSNPDANILFPMLFVVAYVCCFMDFSTIWKYVGISNQILATVTLWTAAAFLARSGKVHWIMTVPAMFLTDVCVCYLCVAPYKVGGLAMPQVVGNVAGIVAAFALLALFLYKMRRR